MRVLTPLMASVLLAGSTAHAQDMQCLNPVDVTGSMHDLQRRDFSAHVQLSDVALGPATVGYGPGADLAFETTIADGTYWLSHGENGALVVNHDPADKGAVFLVRADAGQWLELPAMPGTFDLAELDETLGQIAAQHGCDGDMTFPFKIVGHAAELNWSAESKPDRMTGSLEDTDVTIVGVYSNHDKQATFMSRGFSLHAHFITADGKIAGHVQDVSLDDGAKLFVPMKKGEENG